MQIVLGFLCLHMPVCRQNEILSHERLNNSYMVWLQNCYMFQCLVFRILKIMFRIFYYFQILQYSTTGSTKSEGHDKAA